MVVQSWLKLDLALNLDVSLQESSPTAVSQTVDDFIRIPQIWQVHKYDKHWLEKDFFFQEMYSCEDRPHYWKFVIFFSIFLEIWEQLPKVIYMIAKNQD